jgi:hypothetical protein
VAAVQKELNPYMATIFLSYRRTDSPQACRVHQWLAQRFGNDAVFMDVADIPFAVNFRNYIQQEISNSKVLIALIGSGWQKRIREENDPVRMEIETAIANHVPVLPVLIGNTPMPDAEALPTSIAMISSQNAITVGVSYDFYTHMQALVPKIEAILGALSEKSVATSDPQMVEHACGGIIQYLANKFFESDMEESIPGTNWMVIGTEQFIKTMNSPSCVTLFLHRVARLAELVELHFLLSFWTRDPSAGHLLVGWVMSQLERTPVISNEYFAPGVMTDECDLKIRLSDEDARQVWKMITDDPLQLSLAYIATISPKRRA